jgi:non-ribosomal peptide synthetase component E (peptide arylation enzyme)
MARPVRYTPEKVMEYIGNGYWEAMLACDYWDRNAELYPEKEAIVVGETRLTWAEGKKLIDRMALGLVELGIQRDQIVALQLPNCAELYPLRAAGEKAGIIIASIMPTMRHAEVKAILAHTEASAIVIPWKHHDFDYFEMVQEIRSAVPSLKHIIVQGDEVPPGAIPLQNMREQPLEDKCPPKHLEGARMSSTETCFILTTTGTTGPPKCIEVATAPRQFTARVASKRHQITQDDIIGVFCPGFSGLVEDYYYGAPMAGAKLVMAENFAPEELLSLIERESVTAMVTVPTILVRMLSHPGLKQCDLSSLRSVRSGGAPLPYEQAVEAEEKLGCRLIPQYGANDVAMVTTGAWDDPREARLRSVGRPPDGLEVKLFDDRDQEVPQGGVGEVVVRGPHCMPGYHKDPEALAEAWMGGWFHMGDLGRIDRDGFLYIVGRKKDMILRGGQNIFPAEVEEILMQHPKVTGAAVVRMPDPVMGERACAYVVPRAEEEISFEEIVAFFKEKKVASFKIPERLELIPELPLVSAQKVDKKVLEEDLLKKLKEEDKL